MLCVEERWACGPSEEQDARVDGSSDEGPQTSTGSSILGNLTPSHNTVILRVDP